MTDAPIKPVPQVTPLTRPFWDAAAKGELRMQRCRNCGHIRFPIGPVCTTCLNDAADWVLLSGKGAILTHIGQQGEVCKHCLFSSSRCVMFLLVFFKVSSFARQSITVSCASIPCTRNSFPFSFFYDLVSSSRSSTSHCCI